MKLNKGFTLIELLVVIAIIGILSSVVLASLTTARTRGQAAAVQSQLSNMRAQAELYYSTNSNSYSATAFAEDSCATTSGTLFGTASNGLGSLINGVLASEGNDATKTRCAASATTWAVAAQNPANTANYYCVDSTGTSKDSAQASADAAIATSGLCN